MPRPRGSKNKPRHIESEFNKEIEKVDVSIDKIQNSMDASTNVDRGSVPIKETEPQTLLSSKEEKKYDAPYLKPTKTMPPTGKPHPKQEAARKRGWEYVKGIAEHNEIIGETIELWKNPFAGDPVGFWEIPTNKPVYMPRWLAEHLASLSYIRWKMEDRPLPYLQTEMTSDGIASQPSGQFVAEHRVRRLDFRSTEFGILR